MIGMHHTFYKTYSVLDYIRHFALNGQLKDYSSLKVTSGLPQQCRRMKLTKAVFIIVTASEMFRFYARHFVVLDILVSVYMHLEN